MFAVTTSQDKLSVLRTGNIGPCVAFFGINERSGVAFMSHVDGNLYGIGAMRDRLKEATNNDLDGFSLYFTTNYTLIARLAFLTFSIFIYITFSLNCVTITMLGAGVYFLFGSLLQIFLFSAMVFKTVCVRPWNPWQFRGRVEITVDAASTKGPGTPLEETITKAESKERYGRSVCWLSGQREATPKG